MGFAFVEWSSNVSFVGLFWDEIRRRGREGVSVEFGLRGEYGRSIFVFLYSRRF